jgi:hypothetical protein
LYFTQIPAKSKKTISIHAVAVLKELKSLENHISSKNQINSKDDYFKVVVLEDQTQVTGFESG